MTDELYDKQLKRERDIRHKSINRFKRDNATSAKNNTFTETDTGNHILRHYMPIMIKATDEWLKSIETGHARRKAQAYTLLKAIDTPTISYLFLRALVNRAIGSNYTKASSQTMNKPRLTSVCLSAGRMIEDEIKLREFDKQYKVLSNVVHTDFNKRELPRHKREEFMKSVFNKKGMDWNIWTAAERLHVGTALLNIFIETTGDASIVNIISGNRQNYFIELSDGIMGLLERTDAYNEHLMFLYEPMVSQPRDWSSTNLFIGGYNSLEVTPYPLIKFGKRSYRERLQASADEGHLEPIFKAVNAIQKTAWCINKPVLKILEWAFEENLETAGLPTANPIEPIAWPVELGELKVTEIIQLPDEDPRRQIYTDFKRERFLTHEANRTIIGKRVMAMRTFALAHEYASFDQFYFPHDLDSRGRLYPRSSALNPQGTDYVKALLKFATPKTVGVDGLRWLAIHGANCWGHDKLPLEQREDWTRTNYDLIRSVAENPRTDRRWMEADSPAQFIAFATEWHKASSMVNPVEFKTGLHVDLDATCSGLQHFAAILRDPVGGRAVNMTATDVRHDVYQEVADCAMKLIERDVREPGDTIVLARAAMEFGVTRAMTKRPVMVKPYAGTRSSCNNYVADSIQDRISSGEPMPVPDDMLQEFKMYVAGIVWEAIPMIVVAADEAMEWLKNATKVIAKNKPKNRSITWRSPSGLPIEQQKFNVKSRQINTFFDGKRLQPRLQEEVDSIDVRALSNTIPPSFVHSLDASHLHLTIAELANHGITDFACVHDSFGVHPSEVETMSRVIREQFREMYETQGSPLLNFLDANRSNLTTEQYTELRDSIPQQGSLDLSDLVNNQYFFS